jgi:N-methylhydantoinase A
VTTSAGRRSGLFLGVDIGGTFTDIVAVDEQGGIKVAKTRSTPADYSEGVLDGLRKIGVSGSEIGRFVHGTTAALNAILTKSGAPTGLLTTAGFRDVLEIRRGDREQLFDYWWRPPAPLVPRNNRLTARERIGFDGAVVEPLREDDVLDAVARFRARGLESVAICFLNSFVNPEHERRAKELVEDAWAEAYVCASVDILPEILEFERTSTTVANAYVGPIMRGYLNELVSRIESVGYEDDVLVMASAGHVTSAEEALRAPIGTAKSGVAAGAMAGAALGEATSRANLLTLDIGGTSSDIAVVSDGKPRLTTEWFLEFGVPIKLPAVDIHSVGAGGGSIAWVDEGGILNVGPRSAGAEPGPAAYGRGGTEPTTTDAQIVLGRLDLELWERLYGWPLDRDAAEDTMRRRIADPLELDVVAAAVAVIDVTVSNLVDAIRLVSVQRGYDPREFTLAAYGGAGPMYAVDVARALEIPEVVIPPAPGVTSALGLLQVDLAAHAQRSVLTRQSLLEPQAIGTLFHELENEAHARVGVNGSITVERQADVRYFGQSRYITIAAPDGQWDDAATAAVVAGFNAAHEREYGYTMPPAVSEVELVNLRVIASAGTPRLQAVVPAAVLPAEARTRRAFFAGVGFVDVPVLERAALEPDEQIAGPALVEQVDSTTILPPGSAAHVGPAGELVVRV